ncbi:hypothetical protein ADK52_20900 [Streptomyces sp. WM6372]|uniref:hypothetical protein n=1 Tax=Streptomyces sp. WM6372 TaxID=1415555 RepID=UPI0006B05BFB|nr:hypothetical protein [Streptomyces sp. WM6372]KOU22501.1 hypothetical protein ADK52_20900 [Streptomyces sp. WM6372]
MPRGRHRNPEPLHRLLTPTTVAGVSVASAAAAWLLAEPLPLRLLVALSAAAGVSGAVVMRAWDRAAGRRVAELARERIKDEWKTEERIAELESDLEEARALRAKLDAKLRAKRVELAGLRGEHAALLRRYATAETERASALEGRRLLAIEASAAPESPAAPKELPPVSEERTSSGAPTSVGYARAHAAMAALARKAEAEPAQPKALPAKGAEPMALETGHARTGAVPARRPAAAVAPYSAARRSASRVEGGFDFFGTKTAAQARAVIESVQNEDLADVVGAEALAVHKAESAQADLTAAEQPVKDQGFKQPTPEQRAVGQVIDLTAHDETEPIDVVRLRTAIS